MIRVNLETISMGSIPGTSLILLRPAQGEQGRDSILPICIGPVEAACIGRALNPDAASRPMTHALLNATIAQLGGRVSHVSIDKVTRGLPTPSPSPCGRRPPSTSTTP